MKIIYSIQLTIVCALLSFQSLRSQLPVNPVISTSDGISNIRSFTGIISDQYANGVPKLWKSLVNGKAEGFWLEWYPDGTLRYRAYWKNDLGHGRWEYFHPNGRLRSESFYISDIAQGIYRSYYDNGQLESDGNYLNGKKNGVELIYDRSGGLLKRNFYDSGLLVIDQPTLFEPGKFSDHQSNVWGICFSPDGYMAYFTKRDASTQKKRIYESRKTDTGWTQPVIAPFSTNEDEAPFINQQGSRLYFASYRPLPNKSTKRKTDSNIWFMDRTGSGWSEPKPVPGNINKLMLESDQWPANYEANPATCRNGNLYFTDKASGGKVTSLYFAPLEANGSFGSPIELKEPSSDQHFDGAPILSADETVLFFTSDNRPDGLSGSDIYYSKKVNGSWTKPKNLMPQVINSYYDDGFPSFSPDGRYFYFSSTRAGKKDINGEYIWDLYYIETRFLFLE